MDFVCNVHVMYDMSNNGQNVESLCGHCTNERRIRMQDKKVRRDVI